MQGVSHGAAVELRVVLEVLPFLLVVEEADHVVECARLTRGLQFHRLLIGRADLGERQEVVVEAVVVEPGLVFRVTVAREEPEIERVRDLEIDRQ